MNIQTINIHLGHSPIAAAELAALFANTEQECAKAEPQPMAAMAQPPIGEYWIGQGGIYAGMVRDRDTGKSFCLIVPTDPKAIFAKRSLGTYGTDVKGTTSYHDGPANTRAFAEAGSDLCKEVLALEIDGHKDFYLPSQTELMMCWINVPELFEKVWHLSSTQYSAHYAWGQTFGDGGTRTHGKKYEAVGRACRRLFL